MVCRKRFSPGFVCVPVCVCPLVLDSCGSSFTEQNPFKLVQQDYFHIQTVGNHHPLAGLGPFKDQGEFLSYLIYVFFKIGYNTACMDLDHFSLKYFFLLKLF